MTESNEDELQEGYTTGTYAAATARASAINLLTDRDPDNVTLELPIGRSVEIPVKLENQADNFAQYSAVKDAGDDPDITDGALVISTVQPASESGIEITGGEGIGVVTLPGMPVEPGEPAINPVPRKMIRQAVRDVLGSSDVTGLRVEVSIEDGEELAKRTLNPRLGIEGGLSVLGTTGIVKPYSHASFIATIEQGIDVAKANGETRVVFTTGGRTEKIAQSRHENLPDYCFVQFGGFFEETLNALTERELERADVYFMPGKFSKLAQGNLRLHSNESRLNPEQLRNEIYRITSPDPATRESLESLQSTNQMLDLLEPTEIQQLVKEWLMRASELIRKEFDGRLQTRQMYLHVVSINRRYLGQKRVELS